MDQNLTGDSVLGKRSIEDKLPFEEKTRTLKRPKNFDTQFESAQSHKLIFFNSPLPTQIQEEPTETPADRLAAMKSKLSLEQSINLHQ